MMANLLAYGVIVLAVIFLFLSALAWQKIGKIEAKILDGSGSSIQNKFRLSRGIVYAFSLLSEKYHAKVIPDIDLGLMSSSDRRVVKGYLYFLVFMIIYISFLPLLIQYFSKIH